MSDALWVDALWKLLKWSLAGLAVTTIILGVLGVRPWTGEKRD